MFWKKLSSKFSALNKNKNTLASSHLDKKLLRNIRPTRWPSWSQFKYLKNFLDPKEKKVVLATMLILVLTVCSWLTVFLYQHTIWGPKSGGEYSEGLIGQPKYINPLFSSVNDVDADIGYLIYSGLFRYDNNLKLTPDLAESFTISSDQRVYEITLKSNIKWSDSENFSADDVIYTFENIQNPEVGSSLYTAFAGIKVEKESNFKIKFTLKEPFAPFLDSLTVGILPEHIWYNIPSNGIKLAKFNLQPVGSGPFKFEKMIKDSSGNIQSYTLTVNSNYHGRAPYLKTVTFKFFTDYPDAVGALRGQNIAGLSFVPQNLKDKSSGRNLIPYDLKLPQYTALFFNQGNNNYLKDGDLRYALAYAIDKNTLIKDALNGAGQAIDAPILENYLGFDNNIKRIAFDLKQAAELLDKKWTRIQPEEYFKLRQEELKKIYFPTDNNGQSTSTNQNVADIEKQISDTIHQEMNNDQIYYRKNGSNVLKLIITTADTSEYIKVADNIAQMWRAVGIQTTVVAVNSRQMIKTTLKNRDYEILLYGEILGADPDLYAFWHSSQTDYPGLNLARYSNRNADKILESARATNNYNERSKLYQQFQEMLVQDLPAIFLYSPIHIFSVNKEIKGITGGNLVNAVDRYRDISNWYIKTSWQWKK